MSSKEQARRERNRVRISLRRQKETEEERRRRLESERIRAAQRRLNESEAEREQRRYKSRVRGVERRRNETEEERARRRAMNRARMAEVRRNKKKAYESELFGESPEPPENDREHARNGAQKYVAIRPRTDSLPHERQQTATRSYESALSEAVTSGMSTSVNYTQQSAWPSHAISQVPASLSTAALGHGVVQQPLPIPLTAYPGVVTSALGSANASQTLAQPLALHQQQYLERAYSLSTRPLAASGHDTRLQQQSIPLFHTLPSQSPAPHQPDIYFRQLQLDISKINHRPL